MRKWGVSVRVIDREREAQGKDEYILHEKYSEHSFLDSAEIACRLAIAGAMDEVLPYREINGKVCVSNIYYQVISIQEVIPNPSKTFSPS